jgi:hypothetical protein
MSVCDKLLSFRVICSHLKPFCSIRAQLLRKICLQLQKLFQIMRVLHHQVVPCQTNKIKFRVYFILLVLLESLVS